VVLFFQFESRLGLALLLLGGAVFSVSRTHGCAFLLLGALVYLIGTMHHKELADIEKRFAKRRINRRAA
jgi:hypothetical protein